MLPEQKKPFYIGGVAFCVAFFALMYVLEFTTVFSSQYDKVDAKTKAIASTTGAAVMQAVDAALPISVPSLDTVAYDAKLLSVANYPVHAVATATGAAATSTGVAIASSTTKHLWPAKAVYPRAGALLPFNRIVAYYGNFYSTHMGVLGEYPTPQMLQMLHDEVAKWKAADPNTPVIPGIDYIAVTAQGSAGKDGKYRLRMPDSEIDKALALANQEHGIMILDVQVGLSSVQTEIPLLDKYLAMPNVELALDPEFAMHNGAKPGSVIGTMDASDINWTANHLAGLVQANNLPPKILVIHRFTEKMVTNYALIKPLPEVQMVMDMDGWGSPAKKLNTYQQFVATEPIQFAGFKLFYKNDIKAPSTRMLTYPELLKLTPQPLFIQYQ